MAKKQVDIGSLNKRIYIMEYVERENEMLQQEQTLEEKKKFWASVRSTRGGDYYEQLKIIPEITYIIYTRYNEEIKVEDMIMYKDKILDVKYVFDMEEEHKMLEIQCVDHIKKVE